MAQEELKTPASSEPTSFISSGKGESSGVDSTYNDFFQETSDGNISIGPKAQKSGIEIFTTILGYLLPIGIIGAIAGGFHVYVQKGGGATAIKDNYSFLCPYLNYAIDGFGDEHSCDTMEVIAGAYTKKRSDLEADIIVRLNEYIPIKLTKNILLTSPERKFAIDTYDQKLRVDVIMDKFEEVLVEAKSRVGNNIICNGISITGDGNLTTQCTVFGSASGNDDENGKLGSSRIETLRFVATLGDTSKSQFILLNPPTSLSMEKVTEREDEGFETRTTISIQAKFVPFNLTEKS